MQNYKNILIVRTDRIGDVVLTTPVIRALRKNFPQARLSILVAPATRELVDGNPHLTRVLVDDRQGSHRGPAGFFRLVQTLRKENFDLALVFHTKRRTNLLCFLAGIPRRVGYADKKFGFLLTQKIKDTRPSGQKHESQYCLDVLRAMGIPVQEIELYLPLQRAAEDWVKELFTSQNINPRSLIAVHPGASDPTKQWPVHRFAEVMNRLGERYASRFVLIGATNNREAAAQIISGVKYPILDLTGKTTVGQSASLLKHCRLLISNDSGPVHIADALGTPVISIFTRNQPGINPERWQPLGKFSRTIMTPFQGEKSFANRSPVSPEYLELIPAQEVLEAVDALFKLC